jgi:hypothetical protein
MQVPAPDLALNGAKVHAGEFRRGRRGHHGIRIRG